MEQFKNLNEQISELRLLLEHDKEDLVGPAPNLLYIHHQLFHLEQFRNAILQRAKTSSSDVTLTLEQYFRSFETLVDDFGDYLWQLSSLILDLTHQGFQSTVVRLAKIIELEERMDESTLESDAVPVGRLPKGNLSKFKEVLQQTIANRFKDVMEPFMLHPGSDMTAAMDELMFVIDDLAFVYDEVSPLFPRKWGIFPFYVLRYHKHVYDVTSEMMNNSLDAGSILRLLKWVREYYADMINRLGVLEDVLEPALLQGKEMQLLDDYLKLTADKMEEWMNSLMSTEAQQFRDRAEPPDADPQGLYHTSAPVILFQMLNQQLDVAIATNRDKILMDVVQECGNVLQNYRSRWSSIAYGEFQRWKASLQPQGKAPQPVPGGLPEYIMAIGNDCLRSTEFTDVAVAKLQPSLADEHRPAAQQMWNDSQDGFMALAKEVYTMLVDIVMLDLQGGFSNLHASAWVGGQDVMALIAATVDDYCSDFQQHLGEYLFSKLTTELIDRFVLSYLQSMRQKGAKYRVGSAERMQRDVSLAIETFSKYKSSKRVSPAFDVAYKTIQSLIASPPKSLFLDAYGFCKSLPDVPLAFVEDVLSKREDVDKNALKSAMDDLKSKMMGLKVEITPSVFSRLS